MNERMGCSDKDFVLLKWFDESLYYSFANLHALEAMLKCRTNPSSTWLIEYFFLVLNCEDV